MMAAGQHVECKVGAMELLVAHQELAKAAGRSERLQHTTSGTSNSGPLSAKHSIEKSFESAAAAPPVDARPSNLVVAGQSLLRSFQIPGTDAALRVSGHMRLGANKDLNHNLNSYKFIAVGADGSRRFRDY